jgi:hypothetical protein
MGRAGRSTPVWLGLFVAPVLMDAAYDNSLRDLRDNRLPIANLFSTRLCPRRGERRFVQVLSSWSAS